MAGGGDEPSQIQTPTDASSAAAGNPAAIDHCHQPQPPDAAPAPGAADSLGAPDGSEGAAAAADAAIFSEDSAAEDEESDKPTLGVDAAPAGAGDSPRETSSCQRGGLGGGSQPGGACTRTMLPHLGQLRIMPIAATSRTFSRALQVGQLIAKSSTTICG